MCVAMLCDRKNEANQGARAGKIWGNTKTKKNNKHTNKNKNTEKVA